MPERAVPWTQADRDRQSRTLRRLRASTGLEQTPAASALGVSTSQLSRYEAGQTPLPLNLVGPVADLYGADRHDVLRSLGLLDTEAVAHPGHEQPTQVGKSLPDSGWDFRAELLALAPADNPFVVDALALGAGQDEDTQRFLAGIVAKRVAARGVRRTTYPPRAPGAGAPPDRAAYLVRSPSAPGVTPLASCYRLVSGLPLNARWRRGPSTPPRRGARGGLRGRSADTRPCYRRASSSTSGASSRGRPGHRSGTPCRAACGLPGAPAPRRCCRACPSLAKYALERKGLTVMQ